MSIGLATQCGMFGRKAAGGFNPLSLSPALWLDASTLSGSDGTQIATWSDLSGNARHMTQGTGGLQPKLYNSVLNGKPVVRFDGSDDYLLHATSIGFSGNPAITMFLVLKSSGVAVSEKPIQVGGSENGSIAVATKGGDAQTNYSWSERFNNGNKIYNNASSVGSFRIGCVTRPAGGNYLSGTLHLNGVAQTSTASGNGTGTPNITSALTSVGRGLWSGGSEHFGGDIAEIHVYPSALGTSDRQNVESYLGSKWGITV